MIITIECDVKELTALLELKSQSAGEAQLGFFGATAEKAKPDLQAKIDKAARDAIDSRLKHLRFY